jgi:hypothetical protein
VRIRAAADPDPSVAQILKQPGPLQHPSRDERRTPAAVLARPEYQAKKIWAEGDCPLSAHIQAGK